MAKAFPDGWRDPEATGQSQAEYETLCLLVDRLPEDFNVYHNVHWTNSTSGTHSERGEIDFIVVGPSGRIVLIEQKNGDLIEVDGDLRKRYREGDRSVRIQMARNSERFRDRLREEFGRLDDAGLHVEALLFCPDHRIQRAGTIGVDRSKIIDSRKPAQLPVKVKLLADGSGVTFKRRDQLHQFLCDEFELVPDVNAMVGRQRIAYTRLSGGLSQWARALDFSPFRLRVLGTAGSGKTQLALAVFREAVAAGRRPLYVCFNRPLADHIKNIAPRGGMVANYHELGHQLLRTLGIKPDFAGKKAFQQMEDALDSYEPTDDERFDDLIVDEGQDFHPGWVQNLFRMLKAAGRAWWLEDPMQNVYGRAPINLEGWVNLRSDINFRSPTRVIRELGDLLPLAGGMRAGSPFQGQSPELLTYGNTAELLEMTAQALSECIRAGFAPKDIALITFKGREKSEFRDQRELAGHRLMAPTGNYSDDWVPVYSDGEVLTDTVNRFKGRAAPCVIFTEIDFKQLRDDTARRLFVGVTRATVKLVLVMSKAAIGTLVGHRSESREHSEAD
jgi:hypothetical protein